MKWNSTFAVLFQLRVSIPEMKWFECERRIPGAPKSRVLMVWIVIYGIVRMFFRVVYRTRITGQHNVPSTGAVIYVSNHQSHLDPMISGLPIWDRPFTPLARATLFDTWWLGMIMKWFGTIPVDRGSGRAGPMRAMLGELEAGRCVMLYPEGTRSDDGRVAQLESGFLLLVKKSGKPIVPIVLEGAHDVWPRGTSRPRLGGRITVTVLEPIPANDFLADGSDAAMQRLRRLFETKRLELRDELRAATNGRYPPAGPGDTAYWDSANLEVSEESPSMAQGAE